MDNYELCENIGCGSFGKVYHARDLRTNSDVAVKIVDVKEYKHADSKSKKHLKNFRDEYQIQSKLNHPNIIHIFEFFETVYQIVVVTELADTDLKQLLHKGPLDEKHTQQLTWDLVSALHYLHSQRILHRDLKPGNILLDKNGTRARLCDFGLARFVTVETYLLTSVKGTPLYMAPEIIDGTYDYTADLWSLGCVIYEMLAGNPPYKANDFPMLIQLLKRVSPIGRPANVSDECFTFLQGLLMKEPADRITWPEIINHAFTKGHIVIVENKRNDPAFTLPPSDDQIREKELHKARIMRRNKKREAAALSKLMNGPNGNKYQDITTDDNASSLDSVKNNVQTDLENFDTDVEELTNKKKSAAIKAPEHTDRLPPSNVNIHDVQCNVKSNNNLVVMRYQDNFDMELGSQIENAPLTAKKISSGSQNSDIPTANKLELSSEKMVKSNESAPTTATSMSKSKNRDLEKRKLNQNLENFAVRLGNSSHADHNESPQASAPIPVESQKEQSSITELKSKKDAQIPTVEETNIDCAVDYQSPPIENEEWLAFMRKTMHELLEGEFESMKEKSMVSVIVAILRNANASCKVIDNVAQLLALPLILQKAIDDVNEIKNVYIDSKLVPNLIFASKLICAQKPIKSISSTHSSENCAISVFRPMNELTLDELKTLASLYELTCHLVHLNVQFLSQFCDSVEIIASDLLIHLLSDGTNHPKSVKLIGSIIGLLCCALREFPENSELVEKIIFNKRVSLVQLLIHDSDVLKMRVCMLLRVIGRFSCVALQNSWTKEFRDALESLADNSSITVRVKAQEVIDEFREFKFYEKK